MAGPRKPLPSRRPGSQRPGMPPRPGARQAPPPQAPTQYIDEDGNPVEYTPEDMAAQIKSSNRTVWVIAISISVLLLAATIIWAASASTQNTAAKRQAMLPAAFNKLIIGQHNAEEIKETGMEHLATPALKNAISEWRATSRSEPRSDKKPPKPLEEYLAMISDEKRLFTDHPYMGELERESVAFDKMEIKATKSGKDSDQLKLLVHSNKLYAKFRAAKELNENLNSNDQRVKKIIEDQIDSWIQPIARSKGKNNRELNEFRLKLRKKDSEYKAKYPEQWEEYIAFYTIVLFLQSHESDPNEVRNLDDLRKPDQWPAEDHWKIDLAKKYYDAFKVKVSDAFTESNEAYVNAKVTKAREKYDAALKKWKEYKDPHNEMLERFIKARENYASQVRAIASQMHHESINEAANKIYQSSKTEIEKAKASFETRTAPPIE